MKIFSEFIATYFWQITGAVFSLWGSLLVVTFFSDFVFPKNRKLRSDEIINHD